MGTAVRLSIALATCIVLLAAVISSAGPALTLGEAQAAPRLVRDSGPIEARLPEEEPRSYCACSLTIVQSEIQKIWQVEISKPSSILTEPPSREIEKPFPQTSDSDEEEKSVSPEGEPS